MKTDFLRGFLIDPFKQTVAAIQLQSSLAVWYRILDCEYVETVRAGRYDELSIDIWIDDSGLLREPIYPQFRVGPLPLAGYGLVLASDSAGDTVGLPEELTVARFCAISKLAFEPYQKRVEPGMYVEQLTRSLELELPGIVRYTKEAIAQF
jgi:hypothetical protein